MPELPEVETIKLFLEKNIVGLKTSSVEILNTKSFLGDPKLIENKEITSVERRAKILRIGFDDFELLIHLKMSGQLVLRNGSSIRNHEDFVGGHPTLDMFGELPNKSTRVIFNLSDGAILYFNDQRKFGWIKLVTSDKLVDEKFISSLGPEPLEKGFSWEILKQNLSRRKKTAVKVALLDQELVAGIGNIYACEACFLAGIDPRKPVAELADEDYRRLHKAIIESLENGIKYGGSSKTHFANPEGKKGVFLDYAFVYGRDKLPCKKCGSLISKVKLGGRGTFFCPQCQVD